MKRVSLILAIVFVSMFTFSACESELDEIEVKEPTSEKMSDAKN